MADLVLLAGTVITMEEAAPRAQAVAVSGDRIVAVGSLAECRAALPDADVVDTGRPGRHRHFDLGFPRCGLGPRSACRLMNCPWILVCSSAFSVFLDSSAGNSTSE